MKTLMIATIAGAMGLSGAAQAGDWILVTRGDDVAVGVDLDSLRTSGARRVFWSVWVNRTTTAGSGSRYDYRLRRDTIDCDLDTVDTTTVTDYLLENATPVDSYVSNRDPADIVPGTVMEGIRDFVCDASSVQTLRTHGVDNPKAFAATRRSGELEPDARWLAGE